MEEAQKQLGTARESAVDRAGERSHGESAAYREQLRAALAELQAQQTKEMETGGPGQPGRSAGNSARQDPRDPRAVCRGDAEAVKYGAGIGFDWAGERSHGEIRGLPGTTAGSARGNAGAADEGDGGTAIGASLETLRGKIRETQEQCLEETQKQLSTARESALAGLESEATEKSAAYRERLRAALAEMQAQQTKEMETGIQASLEGLLETLRGKIHDRRAVCRGDAEAVKYGTRIGLGRVESEATEKSAAYREQLRAALAELQAQQTKEMEMGIQASLEGLLETLRGKIREPKSNCRGDAEAVKCGAGIGFRFAGERSHGEVRVPPGATAGGAC